MTNLTNRSVSITWLSDSPPGTRSVVATGTAHVAPSSLMCAAKDYSFEIYSTPKLVECTATVRGFGQPVFAWRVNGTDVPAGGGPTGGGSIDILANVLVDDTTNPQHYATTLKNITVTFSVLPPYLVGPWTTILYIYVPPAVLGHVDLTIDAFVTDMLDVAPKVQTQGTSWITVNNEEVVWENQYWLDRDACRKVVADLVRRLVKVKEIPIWRTLPDPPPDYGRVFRQLGLINELIKEARKQSKELASVSESMLRQVYGITPELVEQITIQQQG